MDNGPTSLRVDSYSIEQTSGGFGIYHIPTDDTKTWLATASDPEVAMRIVEGLIMVQMKRFYHPGSDPKFKSSAGQTLPSFLQERAQGAVDAPLRDDRS